MKVLATVGAVALLGSIASAQNYNAFKTVDAISGVSVTQSGNDFTLSMMNGATITRNGKASQIKDIDGFWLLSSSGDINASQKNAANYMVRTNTGGGTSAYGWETQKKNGLTGGQSQTFSFNNFDASKVTEYGLKLHANGVMAHIKLPANCQPVPEPATMLAMAAGCGILIRRRKKS